MNNINLRLKETTISNTPAGNGVATLFTALIACVFIQLFLECDIVVAILCLFTVLIVFIPMFIYGRDIYTLLILIFGLRYTGAALIAKTFYGQALQENMSDAQSAYGLTTIILILYTTVFIFLRNIDRGRPSRYFPALSGKTLHHLGVACLTIGALADLIVGLNKTTVSSEANSGILFVVSAALSNLFFAGTAAEVIYTLQKSKGESIVSPTLAIFYPAMLALSAITNTREFFASCLISAFSIAFLFGAVKRKHIILGLFVGIFFAEFISPITLYVRFNKEGLSKGELASLVGNTVVRAMSDSSFYTRLVSVQSMIGLRENGEVAEYDYYGNNSNVLNRLSFVALIDHIYEGVRNTPEIGTRAFEDLSERLMPGFLIKKQNLTWAYSDFLAWQVGAESTRGQSFVNFSLPMEGLAVFGNVGFIIYPLLIPIVLFFIFRRFTTFRTNNIVALTIYSSLQHTLVEGTSDLFLIYLSRILPFILIPLVIIYSALKGAPQHTQRHIALQPAERRYPQPAKPE